MNDQKYQKDDLKDTANASLQDTFLTQSSKTDSNGVFNKLPMNSNTNFNKTYNIANKKTEKLVTALYMITDCMEADDALKGKLRETSVNLLSDMFKLSILTPYERAALITVELSRISEILSYVHIAHMIGFVSEMNAQILQKEFSLLRDELNSYLSMDEATTVTNSDLFDQRPKNNFYESSRASSVTLTPQMFDLGDSIHQELSQEKPHATEVPIKDIKRTNYNMSFRSQNQQTALPKSVFHNRLTSGQPLVSKQERSDQILSFINKKGDVSIKDISVMFTDRSEKTIQRELNLLVLKGQIKKFGAKRWSRYQRIDVSN